MVVASVAVAVALGSAVAVTVAELLLYCSSLLPIDAVSGERLMAVANSCGGRRHGHGFIMAGVTGQGADKPQMGTAIIRNCS